MISTYWKDGHCCRHSYVCLHQIYVPLISRYWLQIWIFKFADVKYLRLFSFKHLTFIHKAHKWPSNLPVTICLLNIVQGNMMEKSEVWESVGRWKIWLAGHSHAVYYKWTSPFDEMSLVDRWYTYSPFPIRELWLSGNLLLMWMTNVFSQVQAQAGIYIWRCAFLTEPLGRRCTVTVQWCHTQQ
jgi:hypothetical protein